MHTDCTEYGEPLALAVTVTMTMTMTAAAAVTVTVTLICEICYTVLDGV